MLVSKLLNNLKLFIGISHWPISLLMRTNQQKMTSQSGSVLVYVSAGEPSRDSVRGSTFEQSALGSDFEVQFL